MSSGEPSAFKRFILWDYPRASWQYDVIVLLILAVIFLTPREIWRDQPRASSIVLLQSGSGGNSYLIQSDLLERLPEAQRTARVTELLHERFGRRQQVVKLEPIQDADQELKGYMAFTKP